MKILVVSNYYPPHHLGGYEIGCSQVVDALVARGYTVAVLTSAHRASDLSGEDGVYRLLDRMPASSAVSGFARYAAFALREARNRRALLAVCREVRPDLLYFWNLGSTLTSLPLWAQATGHRTAFFVSDPWLSNWDTHGWYQMWHDSRASGWRRSVKRRAGRLLRHVGVVPPPHLSLANVQFASEYLKRDALRNHKEVHDAPVIHWGIDVESFRFRAGTRPPRKLLYVGRIVPEKGIHTAIAALAHLRQDASDGTPDLTIAGGPADGPYAESLRRQVASLRLENRVTFAGQLGRSAVRQAYEDHDILIFPSIWKEPFALTPLEAMASGVVVVGTATGGSGELLRDGVNSLVFPEGDAAACAHAVRRLMEGNGELYESLRREGRAAIIRAHQLTMMVDRIEKELVQRLREEDDAGMAARSQPQSSD